LRCICSVLGCFDGSSVKMLLLHSHKRSLYLILYIDVFIYFKELAPESDQGQPTQDMAEVSAESGPLQEGKSTEKGKDKEEKDKEKVKDSEKEKGKEKDAERKGENEKEKLKSLEGTNLDALLQRLPGCVSRDLIDQLTVITLLLFFFFFLNWRFTYFSGTMNLYT